MPVFTLIESLDFWAFLNLCHYVAVADEKYLSHNLFLSQNAPICRVLARFAGFAFSVEIVKNVTEMANRGKTGHIDSVNRSKNVVGIGGFYYCGILAHL